ncbi:hypothetical protein CsSME_00028322 [Camellia sinensis var. sinensis]
MRKSVKITTFGLEIESLKGARERERERER